MLIVDRGFLTLLKREVLRFLRVWSQTIVPPLLTSLLYVVVFGFALGGRIKEIEGIPYLQYILPGIATMSLVTGAYSNTSSSVFDAKRERYIDDVLASPMSDLQVALAYSLGGTLRGVIVGCGVFLVGMPFARTGAENPLLLLAVWVLAAFAFSSLGVIVGVVSTRIDHISFMGNVIIQPLAFLGGVFYSVRMLPHPLKVATLFDPIFHTVDAARYAALGVSDLETYLSFAVMIFLSGACFAGACWAISRGPNLRY
ncbi:ABC transporter permease [Rubrobacter calidifluminis]|uniref:ABC transporter permease n=1 Tax=Rubrobacter calidifluminis TaxID=1392640 RepID=UPI00235FDF46|nr:ABC transporter permease [Rubrobacter calidifluminis]